MDVAAAVAVACHQELYKHNELRTIYLVRCSRCRAPMHMLFILAGDSPRAAGLVSWTSELGPSAHIFYDSCISQEVSGKRWPTVYRTGRTNP